MVLSFLDTIHQTISDSFFDKPNNIIDIELAPDISAVHFYSTF